ncbi:hypothetical protein ACFRQM_15405 [Streptomyces sp. NPDC056831]|uniref:hypothetical protein n=1 Tax=Streptomyces sp. NPDC056831 TaxID=3345954 RepID=UPI0036CB2FEC
MTTRADELTHHNHRLADQLQRVASENAALNNSLTSLHNDLATGSTSLRRTIRAENTTR